MLTFLLNRNDKTRKVKYTTEMLMKEWKPKGSSGEQRGRGLVIYICSGGVFHVKVMEIVMKYLQLLYRRTFFKRIDKKCVNYLLENNICIVRLLSKHFKHVRLFLCDYNKMVNIENKGYCGNLPPFKIEL